MNPIKPKKGFEPVLHKKVLDFYHRDDVLPPYLENEGKKLKKMKMDLQTHLYRQFKDILMKEVHSFRSHVNRVHTQFKQQKNLKEIFPIHRTRFNRSTGAQPSLQFVQWLCIIKIEEKKRTVIRVVFVSSESHHDATFIYTLVN